MNTAAINKAWESTWLGGLCDFVTGVTYSADEARAEPEPNYLPILRAGNIGETLDVEHDLVWVPSERVSSQQLLKAGDIVVCMSSGSPEVVGKSARAEQDFTGSAGAFCCILRPRNHDASVFLAYWLRSSEFFAWRDSQARGANIQNLRASQLSNVSIPLPPLAEQRRVAALLRAADEERRRRRYTQTLSDGLLGEVFTQLFGDPATNPLRWERAKLTELGKLDRGRSQHRPRNAPQLYGGKYPFIQTGDVANASRYIWTYSQTYSDEGLAQSKLWPPRTLCITIAANIAKTAITTFDSCFPDSIVGFRPILDYDAEYVLQWLTFVQANLEEAAPESAQKNINLEILRDLEIPLPPEHLRSQFAAIVAEHERARRQQRESARQGEQLFAGLLRRAFAGEL